MYHFIWIFTSEETDLERLSNFLKEAEPGFESRQSDSRGLAKSLHWSPALLVYNENWKGQAANWKVAC